MSFPMERAAGRSWLSLASAAHGQSEYVAVIGKECNL